MNIWYLPPAVFHTQTRCEVCGREIGLRDHYGRIERICQACRSITPEKRAA